MTNKEFIKSISFEGEIWKDVIGYENIYVISSYGNMVSLGRSISNNLGTRTSQPFLVKPIFTNSGYKQFRLYKNGKERKEYIHRLVAKTFIPNPNDYPIVDHIDTNKLNNKSSNLKWCTQKMNNNNPLSRLKNSIAKKNDRRLVERLSIPIVRINPNDPFDVKLYESATYAKKTEGYNQGHISAVCRGERYTHMGYKWMFLSDYETFINKSKTDTNTDNKINNKR